MKDYPYGQERQTTPQKTEKFATYFRDSTGLDYAWNRHYSSTWGRFMQADPYLSPDALKNPQGWNRYAYVENDPVTWVDPAGLLAACPFGTQTSADGRSCRGIDILEMTYVREDYGVLPPAVPGGRTGAGDSAAPDPTILLAASRRRVVDRLDDDCAEAIGAKDSAEAITKLEAMNIIFKDLGILKFITGQAGRIEPADDSGPVARYNPIPALRGIALNSRVNWFDPDDTAALLDGRPYTYKVLEAQAFALRKGGLDVQALTAAQFMDLTLLHELAHAFGRHGQDRDEGAIWRNCFKW